MCQNHSVEVTDDRDLDCGRQTRPEHQRVLITLLNIVVEGDENQKDAQEAVDGQHDGGVDQVGQAEAPGSLQSSDHQQEVWKDPEEFKDAVDKSSHLVNT